jgi:FemAB-related protein (PEP-CTERM system-associated)
MHIEHVSDPGAEWDAFAEAMPGATLGHAAAWARILREAYGLAPHYLAARSPGGELAGVLPLVGLRTLRGRRELHSLPFLDAAGVLARDEDTERALVAAALERARSSGASALELRQQAPLASAPPAGDLDRVDLALPLEADEERQWKGLPAKVRNQTRKAEREGLQLASGRPEQLVASFYAPFAVNMRDLGSPVHARGFFAAIARAFGERARIVVSCRGERPVGGLVALHYAGVVTVPWASTLRSERASCPNNQIYWEALRWAVGRRARELDFGRSPRDGGTWRFKRGWGAVERPLAWVRLGPDGARLAAGGPEGPWLRRLSDAWTRLPLGVTAWLGPRLRSHIAN